MGEDKRYFEEYKPKKNYCNDPKCGCIGWHMTLRDAALYFVKFNGEFMGMTEHEVKLLHLPEPWRTNYINSLKKEED